jgi:hypothetical protein
LAIPKIILVLFSDLKFDQLPWWICLLVSAALGITTALFIRFWGSKAIRRSVLSKYSSFFKLTFLDSSLEIFLEKARNGKALDSVEKGKEMEERKSLRKHLNYLFAMDPFLFRFPF